MKPTKAQKHIGTIVTFALLETVAASAAAIAHAQSFPVHIEVVDIE